jgi:hypothetical protein
MYIVTKEPFNAKCTMREAQVLLELLCNEILDELTNQRLKEVDLRPDNMGMTLQEQAEMQRLDRERHKKKVEYKTEERVDSVKNRTFQTRLYLPDYLKYFFIKNGGVVYSDKSFQKKKDSENYVALLAVRRLYEVGLYGDDLYPNLNRFLNQKYMIPSEDSMIC